MLDAIRRFFGGGVKAVETGPTYAVSDPRVWGELDPDGAGGNISPSKAMSISAWWRGLDLVSSALAAVPYAVNRLMDDGRSQSVDRSHPWHYAVSRRPNDRMTAFDFRRLMVLWLRAKGNAYAYIDRVRNRLIPIDPDEMSPVLVSETDTPNKPSALRYWHAGTRQIFHPDEILHYRGMSYDGLTGESVFDAARATLGVASSAREHQSVMLENASRPSVLLTFPAKLNDDRRKRMREDWERLYAGKRNAGKAVLIDGLEFTVTPFDVAKAIDLQLLEIENFTVRQIANFVGVPPHKLGDKSGEGYGSLEQENLSWLSDTLGPIMRQIEMEDYDKLLTEDEKRAGSHELEFDRKKITIVDAKTQAMWLRIALGGHPWMTISEARSATGLNYVDGTDRIPEPANMLGGGINNGDPPSNDDGSGDAPANLGDAREAANVAMASAIRRIYKRLESQALAAERKGTLGAWRDNLDPEPLRQELAPLASVIASLGASPIDYGGLVVARVRQSLSCGKMVAEAFQEGTNAAA